MIVAMILVSAARTGEAAEHDRPTAALIDVSRHAIGPLLEQSLLNNEKAAWLERGEIDKLLREKDAAGAQGTSHKKMPPFRFRQVCRSHHLGLLAHRVSKNRGLAPCG
jgi:hypothetical protein